VSKHRTALCSGCNKPIVWGKTADDKRIPLDPTPPVYRIVNEVNGTVNIERDKNVMVSHFATCPRSDDFSGRGKRKEK